MNSALVASHSSTAETLRSKERSACLVRFYQYSAFNAFCLQSPQTTEYACEAGSFEERNDSVMQPGPKKSSDQSKIFNASITSQRIFENASYIGFTKLCYRTIKLGEES